MGFLKMAMVCFLTARQCEGAHGFRPLLQENGRTGIEGRSRGQHIVNEKQVLICHNGILAHRKSIPQVLPSFGAVEDSLGAGVTMAKKDIPNGKARTFGEMPREEEGLVELPLAEPF